jgi:hypothetical protein
MLFRASSIQRVSRALKAFGDPTGIGFAVPELTATYPGKFDRTLIDG